MRELQSAIFDRAKERTCFPKRHQSPDKGSHSHVSCREPLAEQERPLAPSQQPLDFEDPFEDFGRDRRIRLDE